MHIIKITNNIKINITDENILFNRNEKSSTSTANYKKSGGILSKSSSSTDKYDRVDQFNNKHVSTRRDVCIREDKLLEQRTVSRNRRENKTTNVKSELLKAYPEIEFNRTYNITYSNNQKTQNLFCNVSSNKDKTLQERQQTSKQFVSKLKKQESFRQSTSKINSIIDKNRKLKEEIVDTFTNSNLSSIEFAKKSEDPIDGKNSQKINRNVNLRRNTMFVTQHRDATFPKLAQNKNVSANIKHISTYGKNSLYIRANAKSEAKSGMRNEQVHTNNLNIKQQSKINDTQLTNVRPTKKNLLKTYEKINKIDEGDIKIPNNSINPIKMTETYLSEDEKYANLTLDHVKSESVISESCSDKKGIADISRFNVNQQYNIESNNKEINPFNLYSDISFIESQVSLINVQQDNTRDNLQNNQTVSSNKLADILEKDATIVSTQQSFKDLQLQQTTTQAENQMKKMSLREINNGKFYDQSFPINDVVQLSQIPNTFDVVPYQCNMQDIIPSNNGAITTSMLEITTDNNIENSNVLHKYPLNIQQTSITAPLDFSEQPLLNQINIWNQYSPTQDAYHVEQLVNTTQPTMMHVYNSGTFGTDDFSNIHITNPPVAYMPTTYMQTWNPQLQYSVPIFHNSPYINHTMFTNECMDNRSNNYNDIATSAMSMYVYDQQHKYTQYMQTNPMNNNYLASIGSMQTQINPNYIRNAHDYDPSNRTTEMRNSICNIPMKFNQYYKEHQNNYHTIYDVPATSHPRLQQTFIPARSINQFNTYVPQYQKYYKQNMMKYSRPSKNAKDQRMQDIVHDSNGLKDIPPIIYPREFITNNVNISKRAQFPTRVFKTDFKTKLNMGYRSPPIQRCDGGFYRNTNQGFSKEYSSSVKHGTFKTKRA